MKNLLIKISEIKSYEQNTFIRYGRAFFPEEDKWIEGAFRDNTSSSIWKIAQNREETILAGEPNYYFDNPDIPRPSEGYDHALSEVEDILAPSHLVINANNFVLGTELPVGTELLVLTK